ncbi:MAG TPA: response regulator [archaeon]|nr:response regulator [archaeon]
MPRILIVEDDDTFQRVYKEMLGPLVGGKGNVDIAGDYETAISMLDRNVYDAHVLDGNFPRNSQSGAQRLGIEMANEIKGRTGTYERIVMCTGDSRMVSEAERLGIKAVDKGRAEKLPQVVESILQIQAKDGA